MKKVVLGLISFSAVLFLAACGSSSQTAVEQEEQFKATLVVDFGDKVDSQEISFEQVTRSWIFWKNTSRLSRRLAW